MKAIRIRLLIVVVRYIVFNYMEKVSLTEKLSVIRLY